MVKRPHPRLAMIKKCLQCGREFRPYNSMQKFCSVKCNLEYRRNRNGHRDCQSLVKCVECGKEFKPLNYRSKYCSHTCFTKSRRKVKEIKCPSCGNMFLQKRKNQVFCSIECGSFYKQPSKKFKKEWADKLWASIIKYRAGNKCEYCGNARQLNSHHIYSRSHLSLRWDLDNGVCLCALHHVLGNFSAHKDPIGFIDWLKESRGEEWLDSLRVKKNTIQKLTEDDKFQIVEQLKQELDKYESN